MSLELIVAIDNARDALDSVLNGYASGRLTNPDLPHGIGIQFRQMGTCRMLHEGVADPLFVAQMQAASAYVFGLKLLPEAVQATSFAGCFWDAIAGGYWDAAREIAQATRKTHNPSREHEDDFLYVFFLMQRYFLEPDESHDDLLERWETVLDGAADPKLDLCRALVARDADAFREALLAMAAARTQDLANKHSEGKLEDEDALWFLPVWPEGLALLRLAEFDGIATDFDCPMVPALLRVPPPFRYSPDAWTTLDYQPQSV